MAISGDIKLRIYNGALYRLGARSIATLTENRESRRVMDNFWGGSNQLVAYALERGDWNFALRARQLEADTAVEPAWGWTYAYEKPSDFRRLSTLTGDERFQDVLTAERYADENQYWLCDLDPIYVRYVSDDPDFGFDSGKWTQGFTDFLEVRLARLSCNRITNDKQLRQLLIEEERKSLANAKSVDAMDEGVKFLPSGKWSRARQARFSYNRDRSQQLP